MRNFLEGNDKNVIFGHIPFCIVVFHKFQFTYNLQDAVNQKKNKSLIFFEGDFIAIFSKSHFLKH